MEHRCDKRHSANVKILIYRGGLPMATGWLRNVSRQGLFVASDYDDVAPNQLLEIEILGGRGERDSHRRCRALVAHRTGAGFGLAVDDACTASCELLDDLLARCRRRGEAFAVLQDDVEQPADFAFGGRRVSEYD